MNTLVLTVVSGVAYGFGFVIGLALACAAFDLIMSEVGRWNRK